MAQDWFAQNAPKPEKQEDWFAQNAPKSAGDDEPKSIGGFGVNVLSSGGRLLGNVASAVSHPLDTLQAVGNTAIGLVEKAIPGEQSQEKYIDAFVKDYVDRYGGMDNLKKTLYEDPVGVLADVATLAGGVGLAAKGVKFASEAGKLGKVASMAGQIATRAGQVAEVTDPIRMITRPAAAVAGKAKAAERLYESALKPSKSERNIPKIPGQVATGLREAIPVSEGGVKRLQGLIDKLNSAIDEKIQASKALINPYKVARKAEDLKADFRLQVNPQPDLRQIELTKRNFLKSQGEKPATATAFSVKAKPIPIQTAQEIKKGTYRQLRKKYGQLANAQVEAEKALARGLKDEIVDILPELKSINARESKLLDLDGQFEHAVARIRSHQIFGIGTPIAAGGVGAATGSPTAALVAGIVRAVLDNPSMKSRLAIAINQAQKLNPGKFGVARMATAISRVQGVIDALGEGGK